MAFFSCVIHFIWILLDYLLVSVAIEMFCILQFYKVLKIVEMVFWFVVGKLENLLDLNGRKLCIAHVVNIGKNYFDHLSLEYL